MAITRRISALGALVILASVSNAHDLFFRPDSHFVASHSKIVIPVLSGTFSKSENGITRDRIEDLSVVDPSGRSPIELTSWTEADPRSTLTLTTAGEGTYAVGTAVRPRMLSLPGEEFNAYLKEEGLDQVLERRRALGKLGEPSRERYSKYPKTLLQVGEKRTADFSVVFGYEAEIVPLSNPFSKRVGETLGFRCLLKGHPLALYPVLAGGRAPGAGDVRLPQQRLSTDADGVVRVELTAPGQWYVKFVHMTEIDEPEANHESRWATVSFEIR